MWCWQSPQYVLLRSTTSPCPGDCFKCRTMAISRMLQVSRFLALVVDRSFPVLFFSTSDNVGGRTLPIPTGVSTNTIESCTSACYNAGYTLAGTEYSVECWCGTSVQAGGAPASVSECNMVCPGNSTQYCGGPNRLNLYNYTGTPPTSPPPPPPPPGTSSVNLVTSLPGSWTYDGCWT